LFLLGDRIFVLAYVEPNQNDQGETKKMPDVDLAIVIRHLSMCSSKD
jgi:hypothetical protein